MPFHLRRRISSYIEPHELVGYFLRFFFKSLKPGTSPQDRGKDFAFSKLFKSIGQQAAESESTTAVPDLVAACYGAVLELGPATGNQLPRFQKSAVTQIYGVEPNFCFMDVLSAKVLETGLQDIYAPINCGIEQVEDLQSHGIREKSMDCILSIQVLCSVGNPVEAAAFSYRLLKPGGQFIFYEHHSSHDWLTSKVQKCWDLVWPFAIGGCHMYRPIKDILLESGKWEIVEMIEDEETWKLFPRTWGKLRKAKIT